jgi:hypothetical protein
MDPVDPRVPPRLLPGGAQAVIYAEKQPQYIPLPTVRTPQGTIVTRWSPTDAEKAAIIRGEDVYVTIMTFGQPLQPLQVSVGPLDISQFP